MSHRRRAAGALAAVLVVWVAAACDGSPAPPSCSEIPAGGCPTVNGASDCTDVTCSRVYACENGKWVLTQVCPAHPAEAGSQSDAGGRLDAATLPDVSIDAPPGAYGGPGCTDLQDPDCSLGTALACAGVVDCCGCQDLWVCESGGWTLWGSCADGGITKN